MQVHRVPVVPCGVRRGPQDTHGLIWIHGITMGSPWDHHAFYQAIVLIQVDYDSHLKELNLDLKFLALCYAKYGNEDHKQ